MEFWTSERHGAVEIATFSNPLYNYLNKPVLDELEQLVEQWRDPPIRAVVLQSRAGEGAGGCGPGAGQPVPQDAPASRTRPAPRRGM